MVNVLISKINSRKLKKLFSFLFAISEKICFTTMHDYHLEEDDYIRMIDEYRQRCKEKHRDMNQLFLKEDPVIKRLLKKYHLNSEEGFNEFNDTNYEEELSLIKKMEEICTPLFENKKVKDYRDFFDDIKEYYDNVETHFFDQIKTSIYPLDVVTYLKNDKILERLVNMPNIHAFVYYDQKARILFTNPAFVVKENIFAAVEQDSGMITMDLTNDQYKEFKKMWIRHEKEEYEDEE